MSLDPNFCDYRYSNIPYVPPAMRNEMDGYKPPWIDPTAKQDSGGAMTLACVPDGWSPDTMISDPSTVSRKYQPFPGSGWGHESAERNTKYHYMSIDSDKSGEIRMLCLLPGRKDDPVLARIESCSLENPLSYEALSYAWGERYLSAFIVIRDGNSDCSVRLPQNLYQALVQLRHHIRPRYIWADAVCINQENEEEKSQQVQLMPLIYRKAAKVLIWLGDELKGETGAIFSLIRRMYARDFKAVPPLDDKKTWSGLKALFTREWFWRVWCLQEAVLAPSAEVILGQHSIPWEHIGFAATWIRCMPLELFQQDNALIGVYNTCLTYSLSHGYKNQQRMSILQLLTLTRAFRATDPRDKIYGLLGIPTTQSDPDIGNIFIQPDYTKTTSEVYINCASAIIRHTQSLQLLSYIQHGEIKEWSTGMRLSANGKDVTLTEVPSWVPRWHHYFSRTLAPAEQETQTFKPSASLEFGTASNTTIKGLTIITPGIQFSRVESVSPVFSNLHTSSVNIQNTADDIFTKFETPLRNLGVQLREILETLSITLTAGKNWFGSIVDDREQHFANFLAFLDNKPCPNHLSFGDIQEREAYLRRRMEGIGTNSTPQKPIMLSIISRSPGDNSGREFTRSSSYLRAYTEYLSSLPQPPNTLQELLHQARTDIASPLTNKFGHAHQFGEAMRSACTFRRAIVTESGHVGLGPMAAMPGDVVCILRDAVMPMVLRPVDGGNSFKVVGESYIHGIMFGEVGKYPAGPIPGEQIVLSEKSFVEPVETERSSEVLPVNEINTEEGFDLAG